MYHDYRAVQTAELRCHRAQTLRELHTEGKTRADIEGALQIIPFVRLEIISHENGYADRSQAPRHDSSSQKTQSSPRSAHDIPLPLQRQLCVHFYNSQGQITHLTSSQEANVMPQSKDMSDFFEEIITNPAEWDESGLLKLRRRIDPSGPQHLCKVGCSPNMCKGSAFLFFVCVYLSLSNTDVLVGEELEAFLNKSGYSFDRVVYVGDGHNDFCPILRLRQ